MSLIILLYITWNIKDNSKNRKNNEEKRTFEKSISKNKILLIKGFWEKKLKIAFFILYFSSFFSNSSGNFPNEKFVFFKKSFSLHLKYKAIFPFFSVYYPLIKPKWRIEDNRILCSVQFIQRKGIEINNKESFEFLL